MKSDFGICLECDTRYKLNDIKNLNYCRECESRYFVEMFSREKHIGVNRVCKKCAIEKDLSLFTEYLTVGKRTVSRLYTCKECRYKYHKKYKTTNQQKGLSQFYLNTGEFILLKIQDNLIYIDVEDYNKVKNYHWLLKKSKTVIYVVAHLKDSTSMIRMHHVILNKPNYGMVIDHKNRNGLDNRKNNLRITTQSGNSANSKLKNTSSSGYKGVSYQKDCDKKWVAKITLDYKSIHIGCFNTKEEAAKAYDKKAIELFGEFARLNFPPQANLQSNNNNSNANSI